MTRGERTDLKSALIEALNSIEGQEAIKKAALGALKSKEGDEILLEYFLRAFKEVILPGLDNLQEDVNMVKEDLSGIAIDLKYFKEKEARTEKYVQDLREKVFKRRPA